MIRNDYDAAFEQVDLLLGPTTPSPAFRRGEKLQDPLAMYLEDLYTVTANLAGIAGVSIPCGRTRSGLPIGAAVAGPTLPGIASPAGGASLSAAHVLAHAAAGVAMSEQAYIIVIGLEVHVQLRTKTKLFCRCSTAFGAPSNTQTCPVCIGMPGSLPVMNRQAFLLALQSAVALNCEIPPFTKWDRKNYYYPDLPKGYQISQYDLPMSRNGYLDIQDPQGQFAGRRIRILRAHLEDDAGKSMHDEAAGKADSRIDLNRAGTPLMEIVSQPDIRSPGEAKAFLTELKLLLAYLGVSDCNMQEGSLRVDANVNLHVDAAGGTVATPIVEIKNMNSFRAVERALTYEAQRQYDVWRETGAKFGDIPKQTRGWDDQRK